MQHNLFCDNCHSHVARSLNLMRYEGSSSWNMYKLAFLMVFKGKFTGSEFTRTHSKHAHMHSLHFVLMGEMYVIVNIHDSDRSDVTVDYFDYS